MEPKSKTTTVIEINGIKMEVDLRQAKRVDRFQIGTKVKLLEKSDYGDGHEVHHGVIAGFEPFETLPTIVVAFLKIDYSEAKIKFAYINSSDKSKKKWEIVPSLDTTLALEKSDVLKKMDRAISEAEAQVEDLVMKKNYFLQNFGQYFADDDKASILEGASDIPGSTTVMVGPLDDDDDL